MSRTAGNLCPDCGDLLCRSLLSVQRYNETRNFDAVVCKGCDRIESKERIDAPDFCPECDRLVEVFALSDAPNHPDYTEIRLFCKAEHHRCDWTQEVEP